MTVALTRRRVLGLSAAVLGGRVCGWTPGGPSRRQRRIGILSSGAPPPPEVIGAFREGMLDEGFVYGSDYLIEVRAAEGSNDRLVTLARELVGLDVEVLVASSTGPTQAARAVSSSVPIVMLASHDPVEAGVVASLAQPGGNVTGQSLMAGELMPKQLEILGEASPIGRLAYLTPHVPSPAPGYPSVTDVFERSMRERATALGIEVRTFTMRDASNVDPVLADVAAEAVDAFYVIESPFWFVDLPVASAAGRQRPIDRVVQLALSRRLPSISGLRLYAQQGLLISYGDARPGVELFRSVTRFVARILRGAKPVDLPVERPTRFELGLNAKTASAIGLTLPRTLLDRADVIIR